MPLVAHKTLVLLKERSNRRFNLWKCAGVGISGSILSWFWVFLCNLWRSGWLFEGLFCFFWPVFDRFGVIFDPICYLDRGGDRGYIGHFGLFLGQKIGHLGVILDDFLGRSGVTLGSFWHHFGVVLVSFLIPFWGLCGPFFGGHFYGHFAIF